MGWFKKNKETPKVVRFKKGFRLSKKTKHIYEVDVALSWNSKVIGIVPVKVTASSRANAKTAVVKELKFKPEKVKRIKHT